MSGDGTIRGCVYGAARVLSEAGEEEDGEALRGALEALYQQHARDAGKPRDLHLWLVALWRSEGPPAVQGGLF